MAELFDLVYVLIIIVLAFSFVYTINWFNKPAEWDEIFKDLRLHGGGPSEIKPTWDEDDTPTEI